LGPLFAAQFLLGGARPLPLAKAIGTVGLILLAGQFFIVMTGLFGDRPVQLLTLLGLFYFLCFFLQAQGKGGPAIFLSLVVSVMVPLLDLLHGDLDQSMIMILFQGSVSGVVLSWLAHAALPEPAGTTAEVPQQVAPLTNPTTRALANAVILLGAVTLCLTNSAFSSAIVIPITVASLLLQLDLAGSTRAAFALVVVNLLGGVIASLAFAVIEMRPVAGPPVSDHAADRTCAGRPGIHVTATRQGLWRRAHDIPDPVWNGPVAIAGIHAGVFFDTDHVCRVRHRLRAVRDRAALVPRAGSATRRHGGIAAGTVADSLLQESGLPGVENANHRVIAALACHFDRDDAVAIAEVAPRPGRDEMARCPLMPYPAIAENDGFDQRGPTEVVDVVERRAVLDQDPDDLVMAEMGRRNQGGAVIWAGRRLRVSAERQRHPHRFEIIGHSRDRHGVVALVVERSWIGPQPDQRAHRTALMGMSRDMQRGPALAIAPVDLRAGARKLFDHGDIAAPGRSLKAPISGDIGRRRRRLRHGRSRGQSR
jgi:aromatic ring-cleaving dioxygenase